MSEQELGMISHWYQKAAWLRDGSRRPDASGGAGFHFPKEDRLSDLFEARRPAGPRAR